MSAEVVGTWVSELDKLKEKVRPKKPLLFFSKKTKEAAAAVEEEKEAADSEIKVVHKETTMSEATVCLLMDRFAPCFTLIASIHGYDNKAHAPCVNFSWVRDGRETESDNSDMV